MGKMAGNPREAPKTDGKPGTSAGNPQF